MGVCQSCRNLPATVKHCTTAAGCDQSSCAAKVFGVDSESEHIGMVGVHAMSAMLDHSHGSNPVGAIFEETLEGLGPLERELMLFCATSNVLAVRWLLHLGARWDAQDSNGSSCLHVACRAGSLQVVSELLSYESLLHNTDLARWTPLHIATFMGRREAVVRLLRARACPHAQNVARQTAADLCPDFGTLSALKDGIADIECDPDERPIPDETKQFETEFREDTVGAPLECEHIPFFLPPVPAIRCDNRHEELWHIAVLIFNKQSSYGLAFTVATGLASTYSDALMKILQRSNVNRAQVGGFLGEAMSLSFLTRLSVFDSVPLCNTGILAALRCVFRVFQLPEDFQKIHRLLAGVAQVWWRKHNALESQDVECEDADYALENLLQKRTVKAEETSGSQLKACLGSLDALSQFMFSTVLLHWFIHGDGHSGKREFKLPAWAALNRGLGGGGEDIPVGVQQQIHTIVNREFIKELALAGPSNDAVEAEAGEVCWERFTGANSVSSNQEGGGADEGAGLPRCGAWQSALSPKASLEGWVQHRPVGARAIHHGLPSSMSEVPFSLSALGPGMQFGQGRNSLDSAMSEASRTESLFLQPPQDAKMWLSLCGSLLFFWAGAASSSATPHMFLDLTKTRIQRSTGFPAGTEDTNQPPKTPGRRPAPSLKPPPRSFSIVTLVGMPDPKLAYPKVPAKDLTRERSALPSDGYAAPFPDELAEEPSRAPKKPQSTQRHFASEPFVSVVHLLPDGRWQELHLTCLELWFPTDREADAWGKLLSVSLESLTERDLDAAAGTVSAIPPRAKEAVSRQVAEADLDEISDSVPFPWAGSDGDHGPLSDGLSSPNESPALRDAAPLVSSRLPQLSVPSPVPPVAADSALYSGQSPSTDSPSRWRQLDVDIPALPPFVSLAEGPPSENLGTHEYRML